MKVTLTKITTEDIIVDIPNKCPKCGSDFTDKDKSDLVEVQLASTYEFCFMGAEVGTIADALDEIEYTEPPAVIPDGDIFTIGYHCENCGTILATTEEDEKE